MMTATFTPDAFYPDECQFRMSATVRLGVRFDDGQMSGTLETVDCPVRADSGTLSLSRP